MHVVIQRYDQTKCKRFFLSVKKGQSFTQTANEPRVAVFRSHENTSLIYLLHSKFCGYTIRLRESCQHRHAVPMDQTKTTKSEASAYVRDAY